MTQTFDPQITQITQIILWILFIAQLVRGRPGASNGWYCKSAKGLVSIAWPV